MQKLKVFFFFTLLTLLVACGGGSTPFDCSSDNNSDYIYGERGPAGGGVPQ